MARPDDEQFMRLAIRQAEKAARCGEVPVGAVVVLGTRVLGAGSNRPIHKNDPTAHAEIVALRAASRRTGNYRLMGATMYVTLEPCPMCAGAIVNARLSRLVVGAPDPRAGSCGSIYNIVSDPRLNHEVESETGVLAAECSRVLATFFRVRRQKTSISS